MNHGLCIKPNDLKFNFLHIYIFNFSRLSLLYLRAKQKGLQWPLFLLFFLPSDVFGWFGKSFLWIFYHSLSWKCVTKIRLIKMTYCAFLPCAFDINGYGEFKHAKSCSSTTWNIISPLSQYPWHPNLTWLWLTRRGFHPHHVIL